jgi:hypothetical protein
MNVWLTFSFEVTTFVTRTPAQVRPSTSNGAQQEIVTL